MSKRLIAGICALVAALLFSYTSISTNWYGTEKGSRSLSAGPLFVKECKRDECKTEALMKDARGDQETWAAAGLGYAGLAVITSLLLLIFGIIALTGRGGMGLGITGLVFTVLSNIGAGAFASLKPSSLSFLSAHAGVYLSSFAGMLGIAFGVLMILAARKPAAAPPGYGAPPPGYGAPPPGYGAPPPGYGAPPPGYGAPPAPGGFPPPGNPG